MADKGDPMCREIFRVQAHGLGLFLDEMINTFDPDALIVGGGALEASEAFQRWFIEQIREGMPVAARRASRHPDHGDAPRRHRRSPRRRHRSAETFAGEWPSSNYLGRCQVPISELSVIADALDR